MRYKRTARFFDLTYFVFINETPPQIKIFRCGTMPHPSLAAFKFIGNTESDKDGDKRQR